MRRPIGHGHISVLLRGCSHDGAGLSEGRMAVCLLVLQMQPVVDTCLM